MSAQGLPSLGFRGCHPRIRPYTTLFPKIGL